MKKTYLLETAVWLPTTVEETFEFFQDARNLEEITPEILNFNIIPPIPDPIFEGCLLNYKLKLYGIPFRWQTEIHLWEPPHRFMDRQLKGPYNKWEHTHTFEARDGGTWMEDRVEYEVPGWFLSPLIHGLMVRRNVEEIFDYRKKKIIEIFAEKTTESKKGDVRSE